MSQPQILMSVAQSILRGIFEDYAPVLRRKGWSEDEIEELKLKYMGNAIAIITEWELTK